MNVLACLKNGNPALPGGADFTTLVGSGAIVLVRVAEDRAVVKAIKQRSDIHIIDGKNGEQAMDDARAWLAANTDADGLGTLDNPSDASVGDVVKILAEWLAGETLTFTGTPHAVANANPPWTALNAELHKHAFKPLKESGAFKKPVDLWNADDEEILAIDFIGPYKLKEIRTALEALFGQPYPDDAEQSEEVAEEPPVEEEPTP